MNPVLSKKKMYVPVIFGGVFAHHHQNLNLYLMRISLQQFVIGAQMFSNTE